MKVVCSNIFLQSWVFISSLKNHITCIKYSTLIWLWQLHCMQCFVYVYDVIWFIIQYELDLCAVIVKDAIQIITALAHLQAERRVTVICLSVCCQNFSKPRGVRASKDVLATSEQHNMNTKCGISVALPSCDNFFEFWSLFHSFQKTSGSKIVHGSTNTLV